MNNLNMVLLSGGYYNCTPEWNADPYGSDSCYKLYFPVEGNAEICISGAWYPLFSGNAYFINGFKLDKNRCKNFMNVYWLHFLPESQLVRMHLDKLKPVFCWEDYLKENCRDFMRIPQLFDNFDKKENHPAKQVDFSMLCNISSLILKFISRMTEKQQVDFDGLPYDLYNKLKAAADFIDGSYNKSLKLEEIAQKVFLNPSYFLRLFKKCFGMTPNEYISTKRLNEACRLLTRTNMSIGDISESLGYCNQFYFAKVFKGYYQKTPVEYRNKKLSP